MKKNDEIALVGFSVNAEFRPRYDRMTQLEKGILESFDVDLCGTSANVARAITSLGQSSKVLALTGVNDDIESHNLRFLLEKFPVPFSEFPILEKSHVSFLPIDGLPQVVFGKKAKIEKAKIEETLLKINEEKGIWRIATGVRPEETFLVKELFNKHVGHRSLNPRTELILEREKFLEVLKSTDLLIMNDDEFGYCEETSIELIHKHGPKLVIVTKDKDGGMFSKKGNKPEKFKPCGDYLNSSLEIYKTGAGDWFHASFVVRCIELGKSIDTLTIEEIRECIYFAAKVAGKKITMPGAANGPTKADL